MSAIKCALSLCFCTFLLDTTSRSETLPTEVPEAVGMSSTQLSKIDGMLCHRVSKGELLGASVLVSRRGRVVYFKQFGLMDVESGKEFRQDTIVRIYSMTKAVTSAAALMLHDQGKISLDDPVERYLPELADRTVYDSAGLRPAKTVMTIRHLLLHTSGLIYGRADGSELERRYARADLLDKEGTLQDLIRKLAKLPLAFDPGADREYGVSTDVLGAVVEKASGQSLAEFFCERIFQPLDMVDTGFEVPPAKLNRFAALYERRNGKWRLDDAPAKSRFARPATLYSGGGGLVSTAPDYWRFLMMIAGGGEAGGKRLLDLKTVEFMTRNQLDHRESGNSDGHSFGFRVVVAPTPSSESRQMGEYWWFGRASTHCWTNPREGFTAIILEQRTPSDDLPFDTTFAVVHPLIYGAIEPDKTSSARP